MNRKRIICSILIVAVFLTFCVYKYFADLQGNYLTTIGNTCQTVSDIKYDLLKSAENLSVDEIEVTTANLSELVNVSKEKLANESNRLTNANVPDKFRESNKTILECMKLEYNLLDGLKKVFEITNEYSAVEDFNKSQNTLTALKEKSALLKVNNNNFEECFDLSPVYEKINFYLKTRVQLRYEKDMEEQAEREAVAAAERERIEREKNTFYITYKFYPQSGIRFSNNNVIMKIGQRLVIQLADDSVIPEYVDWFSTVDGNVWDNFEHYYDGDFGMILIAKSTGRFSVQLRPEYDWEKSSYIYVTVMP